MPNVTVALPNKTHQRISAGSRPKFTIL